MAEPIRGEVIEILTKYSVLINVGKEHGVERNMKFKIFELGKPILFRGKNLGRLEIVKGEIEIANVQEKFSIGESKKTVDVSVPSMFYRAMTRKEVVNVPLPLEKEYPDDLEVPPVKVGDKVEQISE